MRRFSIFPSPKFLMVLAALLVAVPAWGKDKKKTDDEEAETQPELDVDEDDFKEAGDDDAPPPKRIEEDDKEEEGGDDIDFSDDEDASEKLEFTDDDAQESVKPKGPGEDTASAYRDAQKKATDMTPDEEQLMWESYLKKYPNSLFRERIDTRMEELSAMMFGERVPGSDKGAGNVDAVMRELNFALPVKMSPVDTRSHASVGFEWGFPTWFSLNADFEYQFLRQLSAHAAIKRDFAGWTVSPGAKYALIKSSRTGTILSGGLDFKLNTAPFFVAFRPTVAFGQRIRVMQGLDLQAQIAADIEARDDSDIRYFAGFHAELRPNEIVSVFWEWDFDVKYLSNPDVDSFRFFTTTFGLKFQAKKQDDDSGDGRINAGMGAALPYATNYWGFYQGGVDVLGDFYF